MGISRRTALRQLGGASAALLAFPSLAQQGWPNKPIRYIVPFAPGGTTDILGRIAAERLTPVLGQPVVIDNKAGQGGSIGAAELARAAPDGYTIGGGTISSHAINASLYSKLPYDPIASFAPITVYATQPNVLLVHPSVPVQSLADFIKLLKASPDKFSFGSAGSGTSQHISGELFKSMAGVQMQHIPYKGSGPMMTDLLGGNLLAAVDNIATAIPHMKTGKLRALAVTTSRRSQAAPEVPTFAEQGLAGYELASWQAVFAPAGTPQPIVDRLYTEISRFLKTPEIQKRFADLGLDPSGMPPQELAALIKADVPRLGKVVRDSGAKAD
ncbi:Bug family tripartite tricarboxylate transporter substrate binding protein [Ramlibacter tataouinensis]|uniref:Candidate extracytoplasmic binding receptor n=1 Tax=Ramlibacter tataouinensis (strain ATCC BAA-407 / DSM 14655 / LMG 21543 / TTB310) TaxID=365046 RepID=F5Y4X9_RAMTT|nr:tripartite tricarboxylate transporter substrate binding protein [Ramlibacter tataouinensis]AEG92635.1 Candidate extracytoplasmic binding receptor [Ramlibacter tataouinensis TTB310]